MTGLPFPPLPPRRVITVPPPFSSWDWSPDADQRPILRDRGARLLAAGATVGYIWLFSYWTMRHYDGSGQAFDFAIVNVLSTFYYRYDIRYHYGTLVLPCSSRARSWRWRSGAR